MWGQLLVTWGGFACLIWHVRRTRRGSRPRSWPLALSPVLVAVVALAGLQPWGALVRSTAHIFGATERCRSYAEGFAGARCLVLITGLLSAVLWMAAATVIALQVRNGSSWRIYGALIVGLGSLVALEAAYLVLSHDRVGPMVMALASLLGIGNVAMHRGSIPGAPPESRAESPQGADAMFIAGLAAAAVLATAASVRSHCLARLYAAIATESVPPDERLELIASAARELNRAPMAALFVVPVILATGMSLWRKRRLSRGATRSAGFALLVTATSATVGIGIPELQSYRLERMMQRACGQQFEFLLQGTPLERGPWP